MEHLLQEQIEALWHDLQSATWNIDAEGKVFALPGVQGSDREVCLNQDFHIWEKGESQDTIWHWFDQNYPGKFEQLLKREGML